MTIFDKFSLDGRVAVVTGGNRGIGRGICNGFAEAGAQVVIAARDEAKSAEAVAQIEAAGGKAVAIRTDVAQRDSLQHLHDDVIERFGRVDVLVNNAGIGFHADALELDDAEWRRLFDTNLDAVWKACQIFGRTMTANGTGSIVNVGSMSGMIINRPQWHSPYGISKAAVHHLTRSLAAEWATSGVRVNAIAPGYVRTEIASTEYEDYRHYWRDEVPMQRYGSVDEIAPTALYLASDATSFMTGSIIVVDGGYTLW
ncbi:MAG: 3-oxoacyl-ACP reductase [Microbacterium sp.]|uniref:SDR family NAD(P)-dependent oxidoreductase n=1 Tax=unclassified Microbacterium TaxID=2609290 RepID=UPI000C63985E|nr:MULTISPECIES: glucose 1-dehydrogenase [unclassified Microbacterium]MAY51216.1 3-oxoacyl-ACP reductase [Microbacterium sp.]HAS31738.1 3-oxoacyl-ACP reductase [Microbacterium sp.]HBR88674.1 3-oxoacyl-ACP reductase [Microbacterium sp.]|tara:strand:- start:111837 stop:112604 length:768 start_codon:yes stop_codon:yes gene_type:complete